MAAMKLKDTCPLEGRLWQTQTAYWKAETSLCWQRSSSQSYGFPSSHVQKWELDHKEGWTLKNWCFWIVALEKTLESPLDCKEIKPVSPKGSQPQIFIRRTDAEAPILWPPESKSQLVRKDPDAGKDWRQEEEGETVNEMVAWHHWLNGCEFEQILGLSGGQRSLACFSPWGEKESDSNNKEKRTWQTTDSLKIRTLNI